jgi:hypothetical protein
MNRRTFLASSSAAALLAAVGCKSWAEVSEHTVSVNGPARVNQNGEFYFTLLAKDKQGQPVKVAFQWSIEWVGLEGSVHKGKSGESEKIRVKGNKGNATLRILGYDAQGNWGEIAKHPFQVE